MEYCNNDSIINVAESITGQKQNVSKKFENIHSPFISKYQPRELNDFQQLDCNT